jgi:hypothetical protein
MFDHISLPFVEKDFGKKSDKRAHLNIHKNP